MLPELGKGIAAAAAAAGLIREVVHLVDYMDDGSTAQPALLSKLPPETKSKVQIARDRARAARAFGG